ncbi:MAG: CoA-binding protein [Acidobacteria bacterium]|nr:CoA-binding protein [Acidobacteriota bacterium]MCI0620462.1 CoA-binding protein [Acidobacteriota bacterium]MCI0717891.1 CoA-binding protein [Acidobacteriota bacterium]
MAAPLDLAKLLREAKTIAVVGLSSNPHRPSHQVALYLQEQGYRIVPVNPNCQEVLGETCFPSLLQVSDKLKIDLVNIFRRSDAVLSIVNEAIQIGAKGIWMQEGVVDPVAAQKAEKAGLWVVMDRCLMIEHSRYVS